jgi:hypothetical protein
MSVIWCLNTMVIYIDTFRKKWSSWIFPHWAHLIDMLSRSRINLSRNEESLDLQTPHNRSREKVTRTHTEKDQDEMAALKTIHPRCNTRREMKRQRRT